MNNDPFCGGRKLPLVEDFYTIQGEGFHAGKPAYFIRLGGCDVGWPLVRRQNDVESPALPAGRSRFDRREGLQLSGAGHRHYGRGALALSAGLSDGAADGTGSRNIPRNLGSARTDRPLRLDMPFAQEAAAARRYCLSEGRRAESNRRKRGRLRMGRDQRRRVAAGCRLYLQPEWSRYDRIVGPVVEYAKTNPRWNISVQAHKFMRIP